MAIIDGKLVAKTIREDLKNKITEAYGSYTGKNSSSPLLSRARIPLPKST